MGQIADSWALLFSILLDGASGISFTFSLNINIDYKIWEILWQALSKQNNDKEISKSIPLRKNIKDMNTILKCSWKTITQPFALLCHN